MPAMETLLSERDRALLFIDGMAEMAIAAQRQIEQADSYRVRVGAQMEALNTSSGEIARFGDANHKPIGPWTNKHCAERKIWNDARSAHFNEGVGMVVASHEDPQVIASVNGLHLPTLILCPPCLGTQPLYEQEARVNLQEPTLNLPSTMPILCLGLEGNFQVYSPQEMRQLCGIEQSAPAPTVHNYVDEGLVSLRAAAYLVQSGDPRSFEPSRQNYTAVEFVRNVIDMALSDAELLAEVA